MYKICLLVNNELSFNKNLTVQDSFSDGEFELEILVNAEETNTKARFKIHLDTNYLSLRMNMLPQPTRIENLKNKISNTK